MFPLVVDPRLAAGRGDEFSASRQRQRDLEDGDEEIRIEDNVDLAETEAASVHDFIPQHNLGYRMLQRMGWCPGVGLGREGGGEFPAA